MRILFNIKVQRDIRDGVFGIFWLVDWILYINFYLSLIIIVRCMN
jgi:hypothetical protein